MFNFKKKYNILILGHEGMLGYDLYEEMRKLSLLEWSNIGNVVGIDKDAGVELFKRHALEDFLRDKIHFDYCINCVAYTNTKAAQTTKEGQELDYKLNALAPKYIAEACKTFKTKLIHISTDYVFSEKKAYEANGKAINSPFLPSEEPFPVNVYGYDKLLGELGIQEVLGKNSKNYAILRVSWLYGNHGHKSFIHKFLNNMSIKLREDPNSEITMTSNEYSVPTSTTYVIECIKDVIDNKKFGVFHAVPSFENSGVSRFQFAGAILDFFTLACKDSDIRIGKKKLDEISLTPKEIDSYYPKYSVMLNPAEKIVSIGPKTYWKVCLKEFIDSNKDDLVEMIAQEK